MRPLAVFGAMALLAGCADDPPSTTRRATTGAEAPPFALAPTSRCLEERGAAVGRVRPRDDRLRALRDLAQRTSVEARFGREVVGLAFARGSRDAALLVDLLRLPDDPYRVDRRRNVVILRRTGAREAFRLVTSCLRPL